MTPEAPIAPGEFIKAELQRRGWTQYDLAAVLGKHQPAINEVILAKRALSPEMAVALGTAFGTGPDIWLHRESAYRLSLFEEQLDPEVHRRARLYELAPIKDMEKRGWIKESNSLEDLETQLCQFFAVSSLDEEPPFQASARKSGTTPLSPAQRAWCVRGARMASVLKAEPFSLAKLERQLPAIRALAAHPEQARNLPRVLSDVGIRLVIVEPLPRTKIDGAAFWLDDEKPVIVLSVRFDRVDALWHTLAHEISHIRHQDSLSVDSDLVGEERITDRAEDIEARADREAAEFLISSEMLRSFVLRVKPLYSKTRIIQFAHRAKVHPGVVTGQLQHIGELNWTANREMLVRVRAVLTSTALTDGWGCTTPAV